MIKKILRNEFFWLIIIILLTIFLRLYRLTEIPPGLTGDEAWTGLDAIEILKRGYIGPYIPVHAWGQMAGYLYYQAFVFKIFGVSFFSLRLGGAIIGILTIIAFYFLAKLFFDKKISLLITFLFSVSHWHLHFSHMAFFLIAVPFFSITSFYFLIKGFKTKKLIFFILGGISLGLGLNTYFSFASSALAIIIFIVYKLWTEKFNKKVLVGSLVFIIFSFIIFLPLGTYILKNPDIFWGRHPLTNPFVGENRKELEIKYGEISNFKIFTLNVKKTLLMFHYQGDNSAINNLPNQPMLDKVTGILMLIGLFFALKKAKQEKQFLALIWFLMALVPGFLTSGAPNARRTIDTLPPIFLFAGLGLETMKMSLKNLFSYKNFKRFIFILLSLILIVFPLWENLNIFFNKYPKEPQTKFWFAYDQVKMCEYLNSHYLNHYVYFFSNFWSWDYETRRFLCPNIQGENGLKNFNSLVLGEKSYKQKTIYILFPPYEPYLSTLKNLYNGSWEETRDKDGRLMFISYFVSPND